MLHCNLRHHTWKIPSSTVLTSQNLHMPRVWCWCITAMVFMTQWGLLLKVWTQLGECRYKFLCRWTQYGSHCGPPDWEVNQYEAGWIRASARSSSRVDLFFFASPAPNWSEVVASWASACLSVLSAVYCVRSAPRCSSLERSWEEMEATELLFVV